MLFLQFSKKRLSAISLFILALWVSGGCGPSKEPGGLISGHVMSSESEAIGSCVVGLYNPVTFENFGTRVDLLGKFEIKDVPFGDYKVMVGQLPSNEMEYIFDTRIPKKYRDKNTSGIRVSVVGVDREVLDIVIK